jgi:hypothetical protein
MNLSPDHLLPSHPLPPTGWAENGGNGETIALAQSYIKEFEIKRLRLSLP